MSLYVHVESVGMKSGVNNRLCVGFAVQDVSDITCFCTCTHFNVGFAVQVRVCASKCSCVYLYMYPFKRRFCCSGACLCK